MCGDLGPLENIAAARLLGSVPCHHLQVRSENRMRPAGTTTFLINLISPGLSESDTQRHDSIALFDLATAILYSLQVRNCMYRRRILCSSVSLSIFFCSSPDQ